MTISKSIDGVLVAFLWANGHFKYKTLQQVILPEGLIAIESHTFDGAPLTSINLPSTLQYIEAWAFRGTEISSITFPESLREIETCAFENTN